MQSNGSGLCGRTEWRSIVQQCTCLPKFISVRRLKSSGSTSHYDSLGLTPSATQADIKSAYYKLSMRYHPDKSADRGAKEKFRVITEAYEVLGNIRLKKLYDKGLITIKRAQQSFAEEQEEEEADPTTKFYRSREKRTRPPTMDDGRPVYDFDAWTRQHYTNAFERQRFDKYSSTRRNIIKTLRREEQITEKITYTSFLLLLGFVMYLSILRQSDNDRPRK